MRRRSLGGVLAAPLLARWAGAATPGPNETPHVEVTRAHPSDIFDYFRAKDEIETTGDMPALLCNYLDKHESVNRTARALTAAGLSWLAAPKLHHR